MSEKEVTIIMFKSIQNKWVRETLSWVGILAVAFLINLVLRDHVFAITKIEGTSMMPTLQDHQRVYLNRLAYVSTGPQHGDIVVFPAPHDTKDYIKRVIGLPGDVVEMKNGKLTVNGQSQDETYIDAVTQDFGPVTVEPAHVFVMGDNRHPFGSMDSRDSRVGPITISEIKGRVDFVIFPSPHLLSK
jgi:signal peptidase I